MALSDTVIVERISVDGYTEVSKTYTNVKHIEVYNQTDSKKVRVGIGGNDTTTNYLVIDESKTLGWVRSNINFASFDIKLKGDTEADTAVVVIQVWRKQ